MAASAPLWIPNLSLHKSVKPSSLDPDRWIHLYEVCVERTAMHVNMCFVIHLFKLMRSMRFMFISQSSVLSVL